MVCPRCNTPLATAYYARQPLPEGTPLQGGVYRVGEKIGMGATSIVYSGVEVRLNHPIAIKEFFPLTARRDGLKVVPTNPGSGPRRKLNVEREEFLEEGRLLSRFNHPGITGVHNLFEENETAYLVMELLHGATLYELATERGGKLEQDEVMRCVLQIPPALETMHLYGLVHADLKPDNLMLTEEGRVVLLDFGATYRYLTGTGKTQEFTPAYAAPEQLPEQAGQLGPFTDIYGLAATLYQLLAGRRPTPARARISGERLENLKELRPDVHPRLAAVLERSLELDPGRRPQDIKTFVKLLGGSSEHAETRAAYTVEESGCLRAHRAPLVALDASADGRFLASGSEDGAVWLWDTFQNTSYQALTQPGLTGLKLGPDASWLMLSAADGSVRLWDLVRERDLKVLKRGLPRVEVLARTPDGGWLGAGCVDGRASLWKSPGTTFMLLTGHTRPVFAMAIAPDGAMAATGSGDLTVRVWEADTGTTLRVLSGHQKQIQDLAFSPDGALLASSSLDRTIRVWDPFSGREIRCFECPVPLCTAFSPDGEVLVAGSLNGSLQFYHLASGRRLIEVKAHTGGVRGLVLLPEGRLATGSVDSTVRLWEVQG